MKRRQNWLIDNDDGLASNGKVIYQLSCAGDDLDDRVSAHTGPDCECDWPSNCLLNRAFCLRCFKHFLSLLTSKSLRKGEYMQQLY